MMPFAPKEVEAIGERTGPAFVHRAGGGGGMERATMLTYPDDPRQEELRRARVGVDRGVAYKSLGDCARRLGMRTETLSGLENGRLTLADEEWTRLIAEVVGMPGTKVQR